MEALSVTARALGSLLRASQSASLEQLPTLVSRHAEQLGFGSARMYLTDVRQTILRELTGHGPDAGLGGRELAVDTTLPGRAFQLTQTVHSALAGGEQSWVPLLNGTERLGVLQVDARAATADQQQVLDSLAALTGMLVQSKRDSSDGYARLTRTQPMRTSAEMQWQLIPPKAFANDQVLISCAMEPAYETAGDAFDYAEANGTAHLAIFDAMGHDTAAGLTANLAMAVSRSYRRQGATLAEVSTAIEETLAGQFSETRYTTAVLAELDLHSGTLDWINHGHPPPLVIRDGRRAITLDCAPSVPLGAGLGFPPTVCRDYLQPGDRLLLYTDGITEARDSGGEEFGTERFTEFVIRREADHLPVPETLRRLIRAVLNHHNGSLRDDATVLLCEWKADTAGGAP